MKHIFPALILLGTLTFLVSCKTDPKGYDTTPYSALKDSVTLRLEESFKENQLAGLSVKLITQGKETYQFKRGMANMETGSPITDSSIFRIASISKTFTAIALMQLHDRKKVDLNADVSDYLGWKLRNPAHPETPITLKMLMSHTSSIRDGSGYSNFSAEMLHKPLHIRSLFQTSGAFYTEDMFSGDAPGSYFSYTNCTWGLIASVIEKISGMTLEEYCTQHLFVPMEMDARFDPANLERFRDLAVLYRYKDSTWTAQSDLYNGEKPPLRTDSTYIPGTNGLLYGPQGGLRCSVNDLEKVARLFWDNGVYKNIQIIEPGSLDLMISDHWTYRENNGDTWEDFFRSYGIGMHRITATTEKDVIFPGMKMIGHPGIAYGLLSDLYFDMETKTAVIFITNGSKKEYKYGAQSTFYQPEEDVFQALNPLITQ